MKLEETDETLMSEEDMMNQLYDLINDRFSFITDNDN